ncbi:hypothetical protein [Gracilimonas amylolytica]|uniref:hypothetical protein n=1 Tax=Gracilimonas amylolytica TaxID=1749045 RepID=UPI0012FFD744|nr:hypothetical protein [Gracilimonas amylolytica]
MPIKNLKVITGILLLTFCLLNGSIQAQILYQDTEHFSTFDWTQNLRFQILDKSHAYGTILYDRGFSRVLTPLTKHEYELDMMGQEYFFGDQFAWHKNGQQGLRSRFSSYDKGRWAVFTELHVDSELSDKSAIGLSTHLQQHGRAERALFEFTYKRKLSERQSLYFQHTVAEFKRDLDLTLSYRYQGGEMGDFRFDFTYQDYLNNVVNKVGNDAYFQTPEEAAMNFQEQIKSPNTLFLGRWNSPGDQRFHWDLSFIVQPPVKKNIFNNAEDEFSVDSREWLYVLNGVVDVNVGPVTVGVFGYKTFNNEERNGVADQNRVDYTAKQNNYKVGLVAKGKAWKWTPLLRISREYYNDFQSGENGGVSVVDQEFDLKERRWMLDAGLMYKVSPKLSIASRYQSQLRTTNEDLNALQASEEIHNLVRNWGQFYINTGRRVDNRVTLHINMHLHRKFKLQLFGAFDLDADTNRYVDRIQRFDKGGAKMVVVLD